jgi:hypothetical protein
MGAEEGDVRQYFMDTLFTGISGTGLKRSVRMPMAKQCVPNISKNYRISTPVPDILYGYDDVCFKKQAAQMTLLGKEPAANTPGVLFPFLVVEFKGDGPSGGGTFWECTNQCLGGAACCVNILERLNSRVKVPVNAVAFSISMTGTEARLYVSWKDKSDYNMMKVDSFLLQKMESLVDFHKIVSNIMESDMDWGIGKRLSDIQTSLESLELEKDSADSERDGGKKRQNTTSNRMDGEKKTHPISDSEADGGSKKRQKSDISYIGSIP